MLTSKYTLLIVHPYPITQDLLLNSDNPERCAKEIAAFLPLDKRVAQLYLRLGRMLMNLNYNNGVRLEYPSGSNVIALANQLEQYAALNEIAVNTVHAIAGFCQKYADEFTVQSVQHLSYIQADSFSYPRPPVEFSFREYWEHIAQTLKGYTMTRVVKKYLVAVDYDALGGGVRECPELVSEVAKFGQIVVYDTITSETGVAISKILLVGTRLAEFIDKPTTLQRYIAVGD